MPKLVIKFPKTLDVIATMVGKRKETPTHIEGTYTREELDVCVRYMKILTPPKEQP